MADFSIGKIFNKIAEYDELTKENVNIDTLVEYHLLGKGAEKTANLPQEDIIETCSNIKNYLNHVLKTV